MENIYLGTNAQSFQFDTSEHTIRADYEDPNQYNEYFTGTSDGYIRLLALPEGLSIFPFTEPDHGKEYLIWAMGPDGFYACANVHNLRSPDNTYELVHYPSGDKRIEDDGCVPCKVYKEHR
ncbi:unnamed protein product [Ambrosiozyma monospora]|uniref:Unnamed protein product n=1 Tax=Ambrosiozyma monospora TaxID=43982 RepID=A0ACB5T962_AMBMO|nr:unnamed protein product [Ambrosiozyma monospora]